MNSKKLNKILYYEAISRMIKTAVLKLYLFILKGPCIGNDGVPFVFTGNQDINQSGLVTDKSICFTKNARSAFNRYNFREYNAKIIEKRRELK